MARRLRTQIHNKSTYCCAHVSEIGLFPNGVGWRSLVRMRSYAGVKCCFRRGDYHQNAHQPPRP
jgi:hypothetical protein